MSVNSCVKIRRQFLDFRGQSLLVNLFFRKDFLSLVSDVKFAKTDVQNCAITRNIPLVPRVSNHRQRSRAALL